MFVHDFLLNSARLFPDKEAVIHAGERYTYSDVLAASSSIANWLLKSNLAPGFRATILTDEPFEYITSYFAILMAGGIAVGMNTQTSERTLRTIFNDCTPSVIFAHAKYRRYLEKISDIPFPKTIVINGSQKKLPAENSRKWLERSQPLALKPIITLQAPEITPYSIAQIIYTSGTTGSPKGVMLRHSNLVANTNSTIEYLHLTENDRVLKMIGLWLYYLFFIPTGTRSCSLI
jgi:long-chain acyl-CoA synthetase